MSNKLIGYGFIAVLAFLGGYIFQASSLSFDGSNRKITPSAKINICDYGSKDFKGLESRLESLLVGGYQTDLTSFFVNTPERQRTKKVDPELHQVTKIPLGERHYAKFRCQLPHENTNEWVIVFLSDESGKVTQAELHLLYIDQDFSKRNEALPSNRFGTSENLVSAADAYGRANTFTREALRRQLISVGFILYDSCQHKNGENLDVYMVRPFPPDSIHGLLGGYFLPIAIPNFVAFFSEDGQFLRAKPGIDEHLGVCGDGWVSYKRWLMDWLYANYPESWMGEMIVETRMRRAKVDS